MNKSDPEILVLSSVKDSGVPVGAVELSKKLNIPQATLGRHLYALEGKGQLERISNKGRRLTSLGMMRLEEYRNRLIKKEAADYIIDQANDESYKSLLEILETRKLLEGYTVEHACKNGSVEQMAQMDAIMLEHAYTVNQGGLGNEQDLRLHLIIAEMAGNTTIFQLLRLILTEKNSYTKFATFANQLKNVQLNQHDQIVKAVRSRDPVRAREAICTHLDTVMSDVHYYYQHSKN